MDYKRKYEDVLAELRRVNSKRQHERRQVAKLVEQLDEYRNAVGVGKLDNKQKLSKHARKFGLQLKQYKEEDRAAVMVAALKVASKGGRDLREDILKCNSAKKLRKAFNKARVLAIQKHLKERVFTSSAAPLRCKPNL